MKKSGILNIEISRIIASMGHGDCIAISDAGLPVPHSVPLVDVSIAKNIPKFIDVLKSVLLELKVEKVIIAEELEINSPKVYESIKRLMPGTYLLCKDNKLSEKRYWESLYEWENHIHQEYYVETLTNLVSDAVKVRVGNTNKVSVHLSGGLDSSTIVGALAKDFGGKHINTYSGKFLGYEGNSLFDETPYADLVAEKFHTNQKHRAQNASSRRQGPAS